MTLQHLPTAHDLEKLPLRAIATYAIRLARRRFCAFPDALNNDIMKVIAKMESIISSDELNGVEIVPLLLSDVHILETAATQDKQSGHDDGLFVHSAIMATYALVAVQGTRVNCRITDCTQQRPLLCYHGEKRQ